MKVGNGYSLPSPILFGGIVLCRLEEGERGPESKVLVGGNRELAPTGAASYLIEANTVSEKYLMRKQSEDNRLYCQSGNCSHPSAPFLG